MIWIGSHLRSALGLDDSCFHQLFQKPPRWPDRFGGSISKRMYCVTSHDGAGCAGMVDGLHKTQAGASFQLDYGLNLKQVVVPRAAEELQMCLDQGEEDALAF